MAKFSLLSLDKSKSKVGKCLSVFFLGKQITLLILIFPIFIFSTEGHAYAILQFTASPSLLKLWVLLPDRKDAEALT